MSQETRSAARPLTIRPLGQDDVPALLDLIGALADYESLPRPDAGARERLSRDLAADPPRFRALLAEIDGRPAGYALYFYTYSTFLARPTLYLEDLFLLPEARGAGAGRALIGWLAAEAVRQGCGRLDWQVLTWNQPAIGFYEHLGATRLGDWLTYRLEGEEIAHVAEESGQKLDQ